MANDRERRGRGAATPRAPSQFLHDVKLGLEVHRHLLGVDLLLGGEVGAHLGRRHGEVEAGRVGSVWSVRAAGAAGARGGDGGGASSSAGSASPGAGATTSSSASSGRCFMRATTCLCVSPAMLCPFTSRMRSPRRSPATSAGEPSSTFPIAAAPRPPTRSRTSLRLRAPGAAAPRAPFVRHHRALPALSPRPPRALPTPPALPPRGPDGRSFAGRRGADGAGAPSEQRVAAEVRAIVASVVRACIALLSRQLVQITYIRKT
ncbi:unnamed protein product, partial [Iphiclides podalirius]